MRSLPFPRSMLCLFPHSLLGLGLGFIDFESALNLKYIGPNRNEPPKIERAPVLAGTEARRSKTPRFLGQVEAGDQDMKLIFHFKNVFFLNKHSQVKKRKEKVSGSIFFKKF